MNDPLPIIYTVECRFTDPALEDKWNEWYSNVRLVELFAVPGFRTQQRFKAVSVCNLPYFGLYTIDSLDLFTCKEYKAIGGGAFTKEWHSYIGDLTKNLYTGIQIAPAFQFDEYLVVSDANTPAVKNTGIDFSWMQIAGAGVDFARMQIAGLGRTVAERGIARVGPARGKELLAQSVDGITIYAPIMAYRKH